MAMPRHRRGCSRAPTRGFTYLWVLFAVALLGVSLMAISEIWVSTARREKHVQLDWIGEQFRTAIASYYEGSPGANKEYPHNLEELQNDRRFAVPRRHLRRMYVNPFTGRRDWELISCGRGGFCGVRAVTEGQERSLDFVYVSVAPQ